MTEQTEKVHVEFVVPAGRRGQFLAQLEHFDKAVLPFEVGYRADDQVQRRQALAAFVDHMELKLRKNDHKKNWREKPLEALFRLMLIELEEFKVAHEFFTIEESRPELVDMANFCLIMWDRLGMLPQDKIAQLAEEK